jgi:hypothetical protein
MAQVRKIRKTSGCQVRDETEERQKETPKSRTQDTRIRARGTER